MYKHFRVWFQDSIDGRIWETLYWLKCSADAFKIKPPFGFPIRAEVVIRRPY